MTLLTDDLSALVDAAAGKDFYGARSPNVCREQRAALLNRAKALTALAEKEKRDLTEDEKTLFDSALATAKKLASMADVMDERDGISHAPAGPQRCDGPGDDRDFNSTSRVFATAKKRGEAMISSNLTGRWIDKEGRTVRAFAPEEKLADAAPSRFGPDLGVGDAIVASITGNWKKYPSDFRAALGESAPSTGGVLVPAELSSSLIDYARNNTAVVSSGVITVLMQSQSLDMARQVSDPSFSVVGENESMADSEITFDAISFVARKIGCVITLSRELAEDAPNIGQAVERVLGLALASEIDRQCLVGDSGNGEVIGLLNTTNVGSTAVDGAATWEMLHVAATGVRVANHQPSSFVLNPVIAGDLEILASGDGTNSAKLWLGPPPGVANLVPFATPNCPLADGFIGDFAKAALGVRSEALIEMSNTAGNAFAKHQVLIKITMRWDFAALHGAAFHVLTGITS
jgi:HK97 family phage major capsid protein